MSSGERKVDKQYKRILKTEKELEKQTKNVLAADKKRDKFVAVGKRIKYRSE